MKVSAAMLLGQESDHLKIYKQNFRNYRPEFFFHPEALISFNKLKETALQDGHDICLISSFRSYEAQLRIWNEKAQGKRALLDDDGTPLPYEQLEKREILEAILRWSAIPGSSRHHWGTDIDVIDFNLLPNADYQVSLTSSEVADDGPFGAFHIWLDEKISKNKSFGFYRPYQEDLGGIAPERWHLSHYPTAKDFAQKYDYDFFLSHLQKSQIELKEEVLARSEEIFERFIALTAKPSWE